jgi:Zn-dependent peptidase ImmA (M78 family)/DNA-binding XRE family transcriptional regulator
MPKSKELAVNPEVLKWARLTSGYSIPQVAQELEVTGELILDIESGQRKASKTLLNRLAQLFDRPITVLFLPEPPVEKWVPTDFRTIPEQNRIIGPETASALREAKRLQEALSDLTEIPSKYSVFQSLSISARENPNHVGEQIRNILKVNFDEQKKWINPGYAFREWRGRLQKLGVYVVVENFPREEARGFSLWHPELIPMIVVSRNEAPAAQTFTLFHELTHVLLHSDAMCLKKESDTLLGKVESWCNKVAAATLVPEKDLLSVLAKRAEIVHKQWPLDDLYKIASVFKVSRHVIAIRLEEIELAPDGYYSSIRHLLDSDDYIIKPTRKAEKDKDFKRNIPKERLAEVGFAATTAILSACRTSGLSTMEAADLLRVRPTKFSQLFDLAITQSKRYG